MNFVELATLLALLLAGAGGLYAGWLTLMKRSWDYPPYRVTGVGAVLIALLLLIGAVIALAALGIIATGS